MTAGKPDANALIDLIAQEPSLDEALDRDPLHYSEEDRLRVIQVARADRARFIAAEDKRKAKREGLTTPEEEKD